MHYGDEEHIYKARLEVVIYKHEDLTNGGYDYQICSIQKCQYMDMYVLRELWDNFETMFKKELKKVKPEKFYEVEFRIKKVGKKVKLYWYLDVELTDLMIEQTPLLGLH
jgi:hypothetical protein